MVHIYSKEWRHSDDCMLSIVICEFGFREKLMPVALFIVDVALEVLLECLVHVFGLSVCLWVKCCEEFGLGASKLH